MRKHDQSNSSDDSHIQLIALVKINIPQKTIDRILRKDRHQIEAMRRQYERGQDMVRVVLHHRIGGGYEIEDGRHRVIAAKLAGMTYIEAVVIGNVGE